MKFYLESGKIDLFLKKSQGKLRQFNGNTADLILLKAGTNCGFTVTSMNLSRLMNKWKTKPLLDLTFCISLVRKSLFLLGKSMGILKSYACGSHVYMFFLCTNETIIFS